MKKVYVVENQDEAPNLKVFMTKKSAIEYMEALIGKKHEEWEDEDHDYVEDTDDIIFYTEADLIEEGE